MFTATKTNDADLDISERDNVLNDVGTKWRRFSRKELSALETIDDLVNEIVAKYGIEKADAQHEVDRLMSDRKLA